MDKYKKPLISTLDKKYVHKQKQENVFIYNLRRQLPQKISASFFRQSIIPRLSLKDRITIQEYYILHQKQVGNTKDLATQQEYLLANIPHHIDKKSFLKIIQNEKLKKRDYQFLENVYHFDSQDKLYKIDSEIPEEDSTRLVELLHRKDMFMTDSERIILSEILEKIPDLPKKDVFYASMFANPAHPFFFEHPNDHVPGMMLTEAARQLMVAICHRYGNIPLKDVQLMLNDLQARFFAYTETNLHIILKAEVLEQEKRRFSFWSYLKIKISVIQNHDITAEYIITGKSVYKHVFERLRKSGSQDNQSLRYKPLSQFHHRAALWDSETEQYINSEIVDISVNGFCLEHPSFEKYLKKSEYDFIFSFGNAGFIRGKCELSWKQNLEEYTLSGFEIKEMSQADQQNLLAAIKRFCYVIEDRNFL